jgi:hypothetical protein
VEPRSQLLTGEESPLDILLNGLLGKDIQETINGFLDDELELDYRHFNDDQDEFAYIYYYDNLQNKSRFPVEHEEKWCYNVEYDDDFIIKL